MASEDDELNDSESIHFVGERKSDVRLNFDEPMWLVEIYYSTTVTHHVVNAADEVAGLHGAIQKAEAEGENPIQAERFEISQLSNVTGGGIGGA